MVCTCNLIRLQPVNCLLSDSLAWPDHSHSLALDCSHLFVLLHLTFDEYATATATTRSMKTWRRVSNGLTSTSVAAVTAPAVPNSTAPSHEKEKEDLTLLNLPGRLQAMEALDTSVAPFCE